MIMACDNNHMVEMSIPPIPIVNTITKTTHVLLSLCMLYIILIRSSYNNMSP